MANGWTQFWQRVGGFLARVFRAAQERGLTEELIALALTYVRAYGVGLTEAEQAVARETIVKTLVATGVSESIARLAVELAVTLLKREQPGAVPVTRVML